MTSDRSTARLPSVDISVGSARDGEEHSVRGQAPSARRVVPPADLCDRSARPYRSAWEHLRHHLERLRLRALVRLSSKGWRSQDGRGDGLQGLVISEQEVASLLGEISPSADESSDQSNDWSGSLLAIDAAIEAREAISARECVALPLLTLRDRCRLSPFEAECLVVAAAPEVDLRYERIYAYLQDDVTRRRPTVGLMLDLLCDSTEQALAARASFDAQAPLLGFHLCRLGEPIADGSSLSRPVRLDERMTEWLLGRDAVSSLDAGVQSVVPGSTANPVVVEEALAARLTAFLEACPRTGAGAQVVVHLRGQLGTGKRALVESICRRSGTPLLILDLDLLVNGPAPFADLVARIARDALLRSAILCIENVDPLFADADKARGQLNVLFSALRRFSCRAFLLGVEPVPLREWTLGASVVSLDVPLPDVDQSAQLWTTYLSREANLSADVSSIELSNLFRLGSAAMHQAIAVAKDEARWRAPDRPWVTRADLTAACRSVSSTRLHALARKITPHQGWQDLVLPPDQLAQLHELCNQARYRHVVQGTWGFGRKLPLGRGITALFSGPPGTGKTMAAQVIASELHLDLFQIDLSRVVSKYIGETEKNLRSVFDEADASQAILFFDEADALFGKRSEIREAHDRFANIEVGYLLQRMEAYEGVAILATNFRQNVDDAFVRRLRFIVEFPFPDEEHRRRIWEVTFPPEAPLGDDVDLGVLACELKLAGGNIKNIALAAAFSAAAAGERIRMAHLAHAARREHQKLGKSWPEPLRLAGPRP